MGTTIFRNIQALDKDAGVNGLVEYFIVEGSTNTTEDEKMTIADGYGTFAISFPHQGQVSRKDQQNNSYAVQIQIKCEIQ